MEIILPQTLLDTENTRTRILRAARELVNEMDYRAIEMTAIASKAGVGRATVYRYYPTKEHLYTDVVMLWGYDGRAELSQWPPNGKTVGAAVTSLISKIVQEASANPNMVAAQVSCSVSSNAEVQEAYDHTRALIPHLLGIAMGEAQSCRQELASSVINDLIYANHIKLLAGVVTKDYIIKMTVQVAERLLDDVWHLPRTAAATRKKSRAKEKSAALKKAR